MSERRQNMSIDQTTKMPKHASTLADMIGCSFVSNYSLISLSLSLLLDKIY